MAIFAPKDAAETVNYTLPWSTQLEAGDTVATSGWTADGVDIESMTIDVGGLATKVRVSGGVNGETATLVNTVTTTNGEELTETVTLPIVADALPALADYEAPTPAHLMARYPAFAGVSWSTIQIHLTDALQGVDTSWAAGDYAPAVTALAAHKMALLGIGEHGEQAGMLRNGVTSLRDGAFSVSFSDRKASKASGGGFDATPYGQIYAALLKKNRGGPRVIAAALPCDDWAATGRCNDGTVLPWGY